jgi:hypothetical protein
MPTRILSILALVSLIAAAVAQYFIRQDPSNTTATSAFLVAALAAALVLRSGRKDSDTATTTLLAAPRRRRGLTLIGVGVALLGAGVTLLFHAWQTYFYPGWLAALAGTAVLSGGLHIWDESAPRLWKWSDTVVLAGIVVVAAVLRFYNYADWPGPFTTHAIEEQQTGLGGFRVLTHGHRPWEFWFDYQMTALAQWLNPKPTFNTIRIPYTIVSALTPIPVYFLLRQLVRTPAAIFGTLLYALSSWNLVYSRCAHPIFPTNIVIVTVLALLIHFGRTRRLAGLPWIGLLTGYTLYSYAGYRGTPLFVMVFLAGCVAADVWRWLAAPADGRQLLRRRLARDVVAAVGTAVMIAAVAAPIVTALGPGRSYYFEAASRATANREYYTEDTRRFVEQRLHRIRQSAAIFMHLGDGSPTFNFWGKPMLDPATAVLFMVGLFIACLRPFKRYDGFLLFVFLTLMVVGTVFVQNLDIRRLQGITVFVAAFCAITFDSLWSLTGARWRNGLVVLMVVIAAYVGWSAYDLYFRQMAGQADIRMAFRDQYTTLIHWGYEQPERRPILLQSLVHRFFDRSYHYRYNYSWLIDAHLEGQDLGDVAELLEPQTFTRRKAHTVVIQEPFERQATARMLESAYPGTRCSEFVEPESARTALTACDLPEALGPARLRPALEARYFFQGDAAGTPFLTRHEPFLGFGTYPRACYTPSIGRFCRAEWNGVFTIPEGKQYQVVLTWNGRTKVTATVDGQPLPPEGLTLGGGVHVVRVEANLPRDWEAGARLSWRHDGIEEVIPFEEPVAEASEP